MDMVEKTEEKCCTRKGHSDSNMSRHKMPKQPKKYEKKITILQTPRTEK